MRKFCKENAKLELRVPSHFALLSLLDKNRNLCEIFLSILLFTLVSSLASLIFLNENIYGFGTVYQLDQHTITTTATTTSGGNMNIFCLLLFSFIVASCQYSLLKSVQPDSASPIHGFNKITSFSRPIYFCLLACIILIMDYYYNYYYYYHNVQNENKRGRVPLNVSK